MIGVLSKASELRIVEEFFQLFKTAWEFYSPRHHYDLVIATTEEIPQELNSSAIAIFNSRKTDRDNAIGISPASLDTRAAEWLSWDGIEFPLYGEVQFFEAPGRTFIQRKGFSNVAGTEISHTFRIGYDLFQEVDTLLSKGQPPENAQFPTLEIHISLIRSLLLSAGISFVEVPPIPPEFDFMVCLTHDVDFIGIRQHRFDPTFWGFIYRATVGSFINSLKGRTRWPSCFRNWKAVLSLPLVFAGLHEDFWLEFDRYTDIERGRGSTFYFIPYKGDPGVDAPNRRAAKYDLFEFIDTVRNLIDKGCEVGLHGIDAWRDSKKGREELRRIEEATGGVGTGVRMHWLYFSENSPKTLEETGFHYDSTFGYNDAVGFRAGTSQVYCPPSARTLLELPLMIQDTALFYPGRMHLSEEEAMDSCKHLIQLVSLLGGALTVNWHTRSLSPERQWGDFYTRLLGQISDRRVWYATASQITEWFRRRRGLSFNVADSDPAHVRLELRSREGESQPGFILRTYHPNKPFSDGVVAAPIGSYSDRLWTGDIEMEIIA